MGTMEKNAEGAKNSDGSRDRECRKLSEGVNVTRRSKSKLDVVQDRSNVIELLGALIPTPGWGLTFRGEPVTKSEQMELIELVAIGLKCMRGAPPSHPGIVRWELHQTTVAAVGYIEDSVIGFVVRSGVENEDRFLICARSRQTEIAATAKGADCLTTRLHYPKLVFTSIGAAMRAVEQVYLGLAHYEEAAWADWNFGASKDSVSNDSVSNDTVTEQ